MNKKNIFLCVIRLKELFERGKIKTLSQHEVNPGLQKSSRENFLYFTLPPCINFQRNSPAMWKSALETWNDPETNYLFFPEKVVSTPEVKLQTDLLKHRLALQRNKHPLIWRRISSTLHHHFENDPRIVLERGEFDSGKILQMIQVDRKSDFPYLSGRKLSNYWLYILTLFTNVRFKKMNAISIIPDTHVIQSSIHLGLVPPNATAEIVERAWRELLSGSSINPVDMHPVLWNWSRADFQPDVTQKINHEQKASV